MLTFAPLNVTVVLTPAIGGGGHTGAKDALGSPLRMVRASRNDHYRRHILVWSARRAGLVVFRHEVTSP
ncbi:MAG: hypothetical protein ACYCUV_15970 [Phycisphaerae bacterium]